MIYRSAPFTVGRFRTMLDRMVKSAKLNRDTFLSLKEDPAATSQALIVLALAGSSFGVGFAASIDFSILGVFLGAVFGAIIGVALGFVWLTLTFLIGTRVFKATSDYWSLARPLFFATSPALVFLLMSIPVSVVADLARAIGVAWMAISTVIAVRTALGLDNMRSILIFILVTFIVLFGYGLIASL
jgi:Yip1-like protein